MPVQSFEIVGGPSKFDLMVSLMDGPRYHRRVVRFEVHSDEWPVRLHSAEINSISRNGVINDSWLIGMEIAELNHDGTINRETAVNATCLYSTKTRKGSIQKSANWHIYNHPSQGDDPMNEIRLRSDEQNRLIESFTKTVNVYRNMVVSNFDSRMGDEDDKRPLEKQVVEEFKTCPNELKADFLFLTLKVIAAPCVFRGDGDSSTRLSAWLQSLAFERLAEMEALCPTVPTS